MSVATTTNGGLLITKSKANQKRTPERESFFVVLMLSAITSASRAAFGSSPTS